MNRINWVCGSQLRTNHYHTCTSPPLHLRNTVCDSVSLHLFISAPPLHHHQCTYSSSPKPLFQHLHRSKSAPPPQLRINSVILYFFEPEQLQILCSCVQALLHLNLCFKSAPPLRPCTSSTLHLHLYTFAPPLHLHL